jgi:hypothetical protein
MLFAIATADVTFAGFGAGATWLFFLGLVICVGVHISGLGKSIALRFGGGYSRTIVGILIVALRLGAMVNHSGLGSTMANKLISILPLGRDTFQDFMTI